MNNTRHLFLKLLALIYLFAFASLAGQIIGLVGQQGVLPAANFLNRIANQLDIQSHTQHFWSLPTVFWLNSSDDALYTVCVAGIVFSVLAFIGIVPVFSFALLWLLYLSLVNIGQDFLSFQWDILLLETGFLAIFLAPWQWWDMPWVKWKWLGAENQPALVVVWLLRILLFRLFFESGFVKLASGDLTWCNLSALDYHYYTQPLPTPVAWYANQLPGWFNQFSVVMVFVIELFVPFLIFAGRKMRLIAALLMVLLQILIALTGNYAFFNLLTVALCILLLDDKWLEKTMLSFLRGRVSTRPYGADGERRFEWAGFMYRRSGGPHLRCCPYDSKDVVLTKAPKGQGVIAIVVAGLIGLIALGGTLRNNFGIMLPALAEQLFETGERYFIYNSYGLFAVMTTRRLEIEVEGSKDGIFWDAYNFKYKPGDLAKAPPIVAPHQPRLDWQMWFAALSDFRNNPWFVNLCFRLLQGEPTVLKLLAHNPFPKEPPVYVRARLYDYHFTNQSERNKTGNWWKRELVGEYLPAISL